MRGHIWSRENKDGTRSWGVQYRDPNTDKQIRKTAGKTRKAAERYLSKVMNEIHTGTYQHMPEITFKEFADKWIKTHQSKIRERTLIGYQGHLKRITPYFGKRKLQQITAESIEQFLSGLSEDGLSPATVGKYLRTLKALLNKAIEWGYIAKSPAQFVKPAKAEKKEFDIYAPAEIAALINAALPEHKALIMTACLTGLRRGELLGLTWDDIGFRSNIIHVRQELYNAKLGPLKSQASRRKVSIPESLASELKIHQTRQAVELESNKYNLVFTAKTVMRDEAGEIVRDENKKAKHIGTPMDGNNMVRRTFEPTVKLAELRRIRFHDLRHSFASLLIAQGENIKYIQKVMGHSSAQVTLNVYSHLLPDAGEQAAKRLDEMVFGKTDKFVLK